MALHLFGLFSGVEWPPGLAPVVVTGVTDARLGDIKTQALLLGMPAVQVNRLRAFERTLSRDHAVAGVNWVVFCHNPLAPHGAQCVLTTRVGDLVGLLTRGPTDLVRWWYRLLHAKPPHPP